ncbi:MAG: glycosyltransferase [Acidobacteria bacterium]|nr:glycosyltransferase [Acidobacteriota bacterium]
MKFLFVASLHHPDPGRSRLPDEFPSAQAEASWTKALKDLGHETSVFWRNVDSLDEFRPLVMTERRSLARAVRALVSRVPWLSPGRRRRNGRLVELARREPPDVVVVIGNNTDVTAATLETVKRETGALVVYACGDSPVVFARPIERAAARVYDLVIANDAGHAAQWRQLGARRTELLPMSAADVELCVAAREAAGTEFECDVGFAGTLVPAALYRKRVEALEALRDFDLAIWSVHEVPPSLRRFHRGPLVGPAMLRALAASRIVPNPHGDTMRDGGNMRLFEVCGVGALQITDDCPAARRWFVPGEHLVVYEDPGHLRSLVGYYLAHDEQRRRIARAGQRHVLAGHTYHDRMRRLVELVEGLRRPSAVGGETAGRPAE